MTQRSIYQNLDPTLNGYHPDWYDKNAKLISRKPGCSVISYQCNGTGILYDYSIFPGIDLIFMDFNCSDIFDEPNEMRNVLEIRHYQEGRVEFEFEGDKVFHLQQDEFCVNGMFPIGKSDVRAAFMNRGFDMCLAENSPKECSAAVCALLRRPSADEYPTEAAPPGRIIYKDLMMDPLRQRVTMRGSQLSFTALEFKLLYFLASNPSIVFSRELIYERVWRESSLYGSKSVNDLICSIRKKMGLSPKDTDYIKTVKGVGYCFAP